MPDKLISIRWFGFSIAAVVVVALVFYIILAGRVNVLESELIKVRETQGQIKTAIDELNSSSRNLNNSVDKLAEYLRVEHQTKGTAK